MVLNSVELNISLNEEKSAFNGKFYYNSLDIKALKKGEDSLEIKKKIIGDACFLAQNLDIDFSDRGIVVYDDFEDMFSHKLSKLDKNKLFVGLKNMSFEVIKIFLNEMIKVFLELDDKISFYLSFNGKVYVIHSELGDTIETNDYKRLIDKFGYLVCGNGGEEFVLPKKDEKKNDDYKKINLHIEQLKNKIKEKKAELDAINKQIIEVESLLEESEFLDKQISSSRQKIEKISEISDDSLL